MYISHGRESVHAHPPLHALLHDHDHALYDHVPYDHAPYDHDLHVHGYWYTFHDRGSEHAHLPLRRQQV
jgi:hypothetical protein